MKFRIQRGGFFLLKVEGCISEEWGYISDSREMGPLSQSISSYIRHRWVHKEKICDSQTMRKKYTVICLSKRQGQLLIGLPPKWPWQIVSKWTIHEKCVLTFFSYSVQPKCSHMCKNRRKATLKTLISNILKTKFELYFQREAEEEIFVHFSATIKILLHHLYFSLGLPTHQL